MPLIDRALHAAGGAIGFVIAVWIVPLWAVWGRWPVILGLGLLAAGFTANATELALRGSVRDYLALTILTPAGTWPMSNDLADLALYAGVLLIVAAAVWSLTRHLPKLTRGSGI